MLSGVPNQMTHSRRWPVSNSRGALTPWVSRRLTRKPREVLWVTSRGCWKLVPPLDCFHVSSREAEGLWFGDARQLVDRCGSACEQRFEVLEHCLTRGDLSWR